MAPSRGIDMRQPFISDERSLALHYLDTDMGNSFVLADYDGALSMTFDRTTFLPLVSYQQWSIAR